MASDLYADLPLSGIQHYCFCPRQWALIHVEQQWSENGLTASGRLEHDRVHDSSAADVRNGVLTLRGLPVRSEVLGVSGDCDAVEFYPCEDGVPLFGREGLWQPVPVEYKHGKQKLSDCDRLQLTAQAMCLEEMFCCRIKRGYLFYHETRRRETVELTEELREDAMTMFARMHGYMERGYTPKAKKSKACSACSLRELCLPTLEGKQTSVDAYIRKRLSEES